MFNKNEEKKNQLLYYLSLALMVLGGLIGISSIVILLAGNMVKGIMGQVTTLVATINLIIAADNILTGYYGYKNYNNEENASIMLTLGGVCSILSFINLLSKSGIVQTINFILPLIYTFEAYKMQTGMTLKDIINLIKNKKTD